MILARSNVNPSLIRSEIARADVIAGADAKIRQVLALENKFRDWKMWLDTPEGRVASELAEPMIRYLDHLLGLSIMDVVRHVQSEAGVTVGAEETLEIRAEWRGERRVWLAILAEPKALQRQLDALKDAVAKETPTWRTGRPPEVKKEKNA